MGAILTKLNHLGAYLSKLLGEPDTGINPQQASQSSCLAHATLASLLPFQAYDEKSGLFFNTHSMGFVLEACPMAGYEDLLHKEMLSLFQESLREGASLQCLLWADHRIRPFLQWWQQARSHQGEIYHHLADRR